jgi:hypothetical protein
MNRRQRLISYLDQLLNGRTELAISPNLTTDGGWSSLGRRRHDRDAGDIQQQYDDALTAWRKNPMAWRIIQTTTDYVVASGIHISSPDANMQRFIDAFWQHPENHMDTRLEGMSDELARAGDLFPILFRQRQDGVSLIRFITKDQVEEITTAPNDWEREISIKQKTIDPTKPKIWRTPHYKRSFRNRAIIMHYSINRPIGAILGESDLASTGPPASFSGLSRCHANESPKRQNNTAPHPRPAASSSTTTAKHGKPKAPYCAEQMQPPISRPLEI